MDIDRANADALLTTTRAVRRRMDFERPVERSVLEECVRIALQAPVGSPLSKQHFVAITEPQMKMRVADIYREVCYPYLDEREAQVAAMADDDPGKAMSGKNLSLARWQADTLHECPALVIAAKEGRVEQGDVMEQASFYGSILPAAWSFMLALRARGLGACWTTLHLGREAQAAAALGLPPDMTQTVLFSVGYYTGTTFKAADRVDLAEQFHWNRW